MTLNTESTRSERARRLSELAMKIRTYNIHHDSAELKKAVNWALERRRVRKVLPTYDTISDPLLIAEKIVDYAKPDRDTLLASVLWSAVVPVGQNGVDKEGLQEIESVFGKQTRRIVEHTLRLDALRYVDMTREVSKKERQRHLESFKLMALWIAGHPSAALIKGAHIAELLIDSNRRREKGEKLNFKMDEEKELISRANNVMGPICHIARFGKLSEVIFNQAFYFEDPSSYKEVRQMSPARKLDLDRIKDEISRFVEKRCGLKKQYFRIEINQKRPAAAREKSIRKEQPIKALGDRDRFRLIICSHQGSTEKKSTEELGAQCRAIYLEMSRLYGRGNKRDKKIIEVFKSIAELDPNKEFVPVEKRKTTKGKRRRLTEKQLELDDRHDDYYARPKSSGYRSIQDTMCFYVHDEPVQFECQIVDEDSYNQNEFGPLTDRALYKAGVGKRTDSILAWYIVANDLLQGLEPKITRQYIFGDDYEIFEGFDDYTGWDFAKDTLGIEAANDLEGISLKSDDPIQTRDETALYAPTTPLRSGDKISLVFKKKEALIAA